MFLKLLLPLCFAFVKTTDGAKGGKGKTFSVLQTINEHKYEGTTICAKLPLSLDVAIDTF